MSTEAEDPQERYKKHTIRKVFDGISEFEEDRRYYSESIEVDGNEWAFFLAKMHEECKICFECMKSSKELKYKMEYTMTIESVNGKFKKWTFINGFNKTPSRINAFGPNDCLSWEELERDYAVNNSIIAEVEFERTDIKHPISRTIMISDLLSNIDTYQENVEHRTRSEVVYTMKLCVCVVKRNGFCHLYLKCMEYKKGIWPVTVKCWLQLISPTGYYKTFDVVKEFKSLEDHAVFTNSLKWEDVAENDGLHKSICIDAEVEILEFNNKNLAPLRKRKIAHVFKDVDGNTENKPYSFTILRANYLTWKLALFKRNGHLKVKLICDPETSCNKFWSVVAKYVVIFRSIDGEWSSRFTMNEFGSNSGTCFKDTESMRWSDVERELLMDGSFIGEVKLELSGMENDMIERIRSFSQPILNETNLAIQVSNETFHVCKHFLASQSSHFKDLLCGNDEKAKIDEISLEGVSVEEFQYLLEALYHEPVFTDGRIEGILRLADKYKMRNLVRECEDAMMTGSVFSSNPLKLLVQLAATYNLERLAKLSIEQLKTRAEVRAVMEDDTSRMDPNLLATLLKKTFKLTR